MGPSRLLADYDFMDFFKEYIPKALRIPGEGEFVGECVRATVGLQDKLIGKRVQFELLALKANF